MNPYLGPFAMLSVYLALVLPDPLSSNELWPTFSHNTLERLHQSSPTPFQPLFLAKS